MFQHLPLYIPHTYQPRMLITKECSFVYKLINICYLFLYFTDY